MPQRLRLRKRTTVGGGSAQTLVPGDLTFLGFHKLDQATSLQDSDVSIGFRRTGVGEWDINAFVTGNATHNGPVQEQALAGAPNTTVASAPTATLVKQWGNLCAGRTITSDTAPIGIANEGSVIWGGMAYRAIDATTGYLMQSYGDGYVNDGYPNIVIHKLNHASGTVIASYGPFKMTSGSEMARAGIIEIPSALQVEFGGKAYASHGTIKSGIATKPHGVNLEHWDWADPATLTASTSKSDPTVQITTTTSVRHDFANRQARDTRYRLCGWNVAYDCASGSFQNDGPPTFNATPSDVAVEGDTIRASVMIRTSGLAIEKEGLLCFGNLARKPNSGVYGGTTASTAGLGDASGYPHIWYGDPAQNPGVGAWPDCCHGQETVRWDATGPGYAYRMNMGWIYPISQIAQAYAGSITPYGAVPSSDGFEMLSIHSAFAAPIEFDNQFGTQAWFDQQTNRVFVAYQLSDPSNPGYASPMIAVFQVS